MDSLLASYASSDDEADEAPPAPAPAPASAAARGGQAGAKPASSSSSSPFSGGGGGIFSSLPQPKSTSLFSSVPAPKSNPTFSTIPAPKSSTNPKRVVQYRPQPIRQPTGDSSDDEEDDAKKRRAAAADTRPAVSAGSGPVSSFLPPPKHSLGLGGGGGGGGARRSAIDTTAPERPSLGAAVPASSVANTGSPERTDAGAADDDDSEGSASEDDMPVPDPQDDNEHLPSDAGAGQQQGYDAGVGSTCGYEAYAWDPNYYAQYVANYGWDPNGNVNYVTGEQYAAYSGEQGGGYAQPNGSEHVGGYANLAAAPYGAEYTGGYGHEAVAATSFPPPPVQDPVLPPVMGRIGGKRGRIDMPTEIVEVNQEELMKNRPKQDKSKLTGLAFGPSYQPAPSAKGKPSKLHKRKHQIGSLYFDMKSKEMELAERRSKGILTKAETQAKYGW